MFSLSLDSFKHSTQYTGAYIDLAPWKGFVFLIKNDQSAFSAVAYNFDIIGLMLMIVNLFTHNCFTLTIIL